MKAMEIIRAAEEIMSFYNLIILKVPSFSPFFIQKPVFSISKHLFFAMHLTADRIMAENKF
jgi:hypothetical protein